MEKPVQAKEVASRQNRLSSQRRDAYRIRVGKSVSHASRKAAIVCKAPVP